FDDALEPGLAGSRERLLGGLRGVGDLVLGGPPPCHAPAGDRPAAACLRHRRHLVGRDPTAAAHPHLSVRCAGAGAAAAAGAAAPLPHDQHAGDGPAVVVPVAAAAAGGGDLV